MVSIRVPSEKRPLLFAARRFRCRALCHYVACILQVSERCATQSAADATESSKLFGPECSRIIEDHDCALSAAPRKEELEVQLQEMFLQGQWD